MRWERERDSSDAELVPLTVRVDVKRRVDLQRWENEDGLFGSGLKSVNSIGVLLCCLREHRCRLAEL